MKDTHLLDQCGGPQSSRQIYSIVSILGAENVGVPNWGHRLLLTQSVLNRVLSQ